MALTANAAAGDALPPVTAVIGAGALPAVWASEALVTDTLAVLTAALAVTVAGAPSFLAVFAHEAIMAHALAIHAAALAVAVTGTGEL